MSAEAEVVRMLNLMLVYGLQGYDFCAQFPNATLAEDYNGIGPEWMPQKLRDALDAMHADFCPAAFGHDVRFAHSDGSHEQFVAANEEFLDNCRIIAKAKYGWWNPVRYIRLAQGRALFRAVVMFGWPAYQAAFLKREGVNTISVG